MATRPKFAEMANYSCECVECESQFGECRRMYRVSNAVFFNLFEVAEPKMSSKNFAEPKMSSKNFEEPKMSSKKLANPNFSQKLSGTPTFLS